MAEIQPPIGKGCFFMEKRFLLSTAFLSIMAVSLTFIHSFVYNSNKNVFLVKNLMLSWIPFIFTIIISREWFRNYSKILLAILIISWIIFLPNTFYMLTDWINLDRDVFVYNRIYSLEPWLILSSYIISIWTSILLGIFSLGIAQKLLTNFKGVLVGRIIITFIIILCSYAIYLGRFLRLNSWEVVTNPVYLFDKLINSLNLNTALFTLIYSIIIISLYISFSPFLIQQFDLTEEKNY
ncbi:Uncharacterized membrane protein [Marininema mesophilum]|uniref:Uncharacterized membrane protein n=2 Tax=Marininema mesophilum TaxID=1048340 RepID=A0A1H2ZJD5_9BACL|nr:Uncharacterized membrane protein [Marininema mesophilum]